MSGSQVTRLPVGPGEVAQVDLVSTTELKTRLSYLLDTVTHKSPVVISRNDHPTAVLISIEAYTSLIGKIPDPIEALRQRFAGLLDRISAPGAAEASTKVYEATTAQLAAAAQAVRKRG